LVDRFTALVEPLDDDTLSRPAYPEGWSIADVLSHVGSAATIMGRRVEDALVGLETPVDLNASVWAAWDAKTPRDKADDGLAALDAAVARLEAVVPAEAERFELVLGPLRIDWPSFLRMRLSEQLVHEWDVAVALDPRAVLAPDGVALAIDDLALTAGYTAKPRGDPRTIIVTTTDPERGFTVAVTPDAVRFSAGGAAEAPDLTMPAEAFVRLVYGRLDRDHTDVVTGDPGALAQLRAVFPGP
jgi:uncharacterized protein (TIGR03083 family)